MAVEEHPEVDIQMDKAWELLKARAPIVGPADVNVVESGMGNDGPPNPLSPNLSHLLGGSPLTPYLYPPVPGSISNNPSPPKPYLVITHGAQPDTTKLIIMSGSQVHIASQTMPSEHIKPVLEIVLALGILINDLRDK